MKNPLKNPLFDFAFFPAYDSDISFLAESLAAKEDWSFSNEVPKKYSILKNYLIFTFKKLQIEKKIAFTSDNKSACFNTGLVTNNLEDIFAYFEEYNRIKPSNHTTPYFFKGFLKKSDNLLLRHFSGNLPDTADYFANPELLIFNPKYELIPQIDHIIEDNIERFPKHLQGAGNPELLRLLTGSIDEIKKKVRTNYKLAVPQYYDGKIQLLLPLCLTAGSSNPDLALVVQKLPSNTYTARTCLTLRMAYNNARLIVKPQSDWLKP